MTAAMQGPASLERVHWKDDNHMLCVELHCQTAVDVGVHQTDAANYSVLVQPARLQDVPPSVEAALGRPVSASVQPRCIDASRVWSAPGIAPTPVPTRTPLPTRPQLVHVDGRPMERRPGHPMGLTRVYYHAHERPSGALTSVRCNICYSLAEAQEVWVAPDAACRWRQSAGEVVVQVPGLPSGLCSRDLLVSLTPTHCKGTQGYVDVSTCQPPSRTVMHGSRVLLEGSLGGTIDPDSSVWTLDRGANATTLWMHWSKDTASLAAR